MIQWSSAVASWRQTTNDLSPFMPSVWHDPRVSQRERICLCTYLVNFHEMSSKFEASVALVLCFLDVTSFSCFPAFLFFFFFLEPDNFHLCLVVSPDCPHLCPAALLYKQSCLTVSGFGRCITRVSFSVPCPWYLHPVQAQLCNSVSVLFLFSVFPGLPLWFWLLFTREDTFCWALS